AGAWLAPQSLCFHGIKVGGQTSAGALHCCRQAATFARKPSTSVRSSAAAASTACAAVSTLCAEVRVFAAAPETSPSTDTTTLAPSEALATFCEISLVAALCSSTAAETAVAQLSISCMRPAIRPIADTAPVVAVCTDVMSLEMSSVALAV